MTENQEWVYSHKPNPSWGMTIENDWFRCRLTAFQEKEDRPWQFMAHLDLEYFHHSGIDNDTGWPTLEAAQTAALKFGKDLIDPEHLYWYEGWEYGMQFWGAWFKPIDARLSVFPMYDENEEPVDDNWYWQVWAPPDYTIFSVDHTDLEYKQRKSPRKRVCRPPASCAPTSKKKLPRRRRPKSAGPTPPATVKRPA